MVRLLSVLALAAAVAACDGASDPGAGAAPTAAPTQSPTPTPAATSNGARAVAEQTDDFVFEFSYPVEAGRIPELASVLDVWLEQRRERLASESAAARRQDRANGFPYNKHSYTAEWKVVSELPDWLSLAGEIATYSGGAHGNATLDAMVWDKKAERAIDGIELFTSPTALEEALGEPFCEALDRERAERRQEPVAEGSDAQFDQCPDIAELEVVPGSSNRRSFDRLTLYAGPYVAGPYAEGPYEIELAVDEAVLSAVKPDYRAAFGARN